MSVSLSKVNSTMASSSSLLFPITSEVLERDNVSHMIKKAFIAVEGHIKGMTGHPWDCAGESRHHGTVAAYLLIPVSISRELNWIVDLGI